MHSQILPGPHSTAPQSVGSRFCLVAATLCGSWKCRGGRCHWLCLGGGGDSWGGGREDVQQVGTMGWVTVVIVTKWGAGLHGCVECFCGCGMHAPAAAELLMYLYLQSSMLCR